MDFDYNLQFTDSSIVYFAAVAYILFQQRHAQYAIAVGFSIFRIFQTQLFGYIQCSMFILYAVISRIPTRINTFCFALSGKRRQHETLFWFAYSS